MVALVTFAKILAEKSEGFTPKEPDSLFSQIFKMQLNMPHSIYGLERAYDYLGIANMLDTELEQNTSPAAGSSGIGWPITTPQGRVFVSFSQEAAWRPKLSNAIQPLCEDVGMEILPFANPLDEVRQIRDGQKENLIAFANNVAEKSGVAHANLHKPSDFAVGIYIPGEQPELVLDFNQEDAVFDSSDDFRVMLGGKKGFVTPLILDSKSLSTRLSVEQQIAMLEEFATSQTDISQQQAINGCILHAKQMQELKT